MPYKEKENNLIGRKLMRKDSFESTNSNNPFKKNLSDFFNFSYDEDKQHEEKEDEKHGQMK